MRVLLPLTTVLALALAGCGAEDADVSAAPTAVEAPATDEPSSSEATTSETPEPAATEPTAADDPDPAASEAPAQDATDSGDCAAAGLDLSVDAEDLPDATRATAEFLLDAALRCDEQLVNTAATESDTTFFFGASTVGEVFALPEAPDEDPAAWEALARLLGSTTPTVDDDGLHAWPAAHGADADEADWQELVDSGLYSEAEVEDLRGAEGYLGWRVGIDADGTWLFMTAGD